MDSFQDSAFFAADPTRVGICLVFFILQTLEVAPSLAKGSRVLMGRIIAQINSHKNLPINEEEDDFTTVELKEAYNQYYSSLLKDLKAWRFRAYVIDFLFMFLFMPIVSTSDGPMRLFEAVGRIDFMSADVIPENLFRLFCSMFLIQLIVSISIFVRKGTQLLNLSRISIMQAHFKSLSHKEQRL